MSTNVMQGVSRSESQPTTATGGDFLRQFMVIFVTLLTISVNALANTLPINGQETGEISDKYVNLFTPAGYVFSIWGLIYLGVLAYMVYQALPSQRTNPRLRAVGWWYVLGNLANTAWIFAWHYEQLLLSVALIVVLLVSLVMSYVRLAPARKVPGLVSMAEWWTTHVPFSIYTGWITVATVANTAVYLVSIGWDGGFLPPAVWTVLLLLVATSLGLFFLRRWQDVAYTAVLVWAFIGIAVKQSDVALVAWSAAALAAVLAVLAIVAWFRTRNS